MINGVFDKKKRIENLLEGKNTKPEPIWLSPNTFAVISMPEVLPPHLNPTQRRHENKLPLITSTHKPKTDIRNNFRPTNHPHPAPAQHIIADSITHPHTF
jgi:hypothetical protein